MAGFCHNICPQPKQVATFALQVEHANDNRNDGFIFSLPLDSHPWRNNFPDNAITRVLANSPPYQGSYGHCFGILLCAVTQ